MLKMTMFWEDFIFAGLMIKSNIEREHIYHLYVVADFDARSSITDLLNDAFGARKFSNLYSVSQTILITLITILPFNRLKLKDHKFQLKFRNIRRTISARDKHLKSPDFKRSCWIFFWHTYYMKTLVGYIQT